MRLFRLSAFGVAKQALTLIEKITVNPVTHTF